MKNPLRIPRGASAVMLVLLCVFLILPLGGTVWKSFLQLDASTPATFGRSAGFGNYVELLTGEPEFRASMTATFLFLAAAVVQTALALVLALWFRFLWPQRLPTALVVVPALPLLVSPTLVGLMGRLFLNDQHGYITRLLRLAGVLGDSAAPLGTIRGSWTWLLLLDAWQWVPFTAVLFWYCTSLVPRKQLEVGAIDGLPRSVVVRRIAFPYARDALLIVALLRVLEALRAFDVPYVLTGGGPGIATSVASLYANRLTFLQQRFGIGAAHLILLDLIAYLLIFVLIARLPGVSSTLKGRSS